MVFGLNLMRVFTKKVWHLEYKAFTVKMSKKYRKYVNGISQTVFIVIGKTKDKFIGITYERFELRSGILKNSTNEIYTLVDELFLEKFNDNQHAFMKSIYYRYYCKFCEFYKRKNLREDEFFRNMHRRRIQLYQLCCPYCGTIEIMPCDKKLQGTSGPNYCFNCGRGSASQNIVKQASRFIRINRINRLALKELKKEYSNKEEWLIAYDIYQNEIISMASLIEVIFGYWKIR